MLCLMRRVGESVIIPIKDFNGEDYIEIKVIKFNGVSQVSLGFKAPKSIDIFRSEVYEKYKDTDKSKK